MGVIKLTRRTCHTVLSGNSASNFSCDGWTGAFPLSRNVQLAAVAGWGPRTEGTDDYLFSQMYMYEQ